MTLRNRLKLNREQKHNLEPLPQICWLVALTHQHQLQKSVNYAYFITVQLITKAKPQLESENFVFLCRRTRLEPATGNNITNVPVCQTRTTVTISCQEVRKSKRGHWQVSFQSKIQIMATLQSSILTTQASETISSQ